MRVLHIGAGNLYGGIETLLVTLARCRHLCPAMQPQFALCFAGRLSEELAGTGVAVHLLGPVRISRPWTVCQARRRLGRLLARAPFEAVVCHGCWPHAVFAPAVRRRGVPLVFWAHDGPTGRHWLERWAGRTSPDLVVANSQWTRSAVPNLFGAVSHQVLYCPVPAPPLPDHARIRPAVRSALQTGAQVPVVVQASRLERWKGQALLVEALGRLRHHSDWVCWIAGGVQRRQEVTYLRELQQAVSRFHLEDRVRFLGHRTDLGRLLAAADIYCQPNIGPEPFGISFIEALAAGLPVVATALGGVLEIVDAECGLLVPPTDPAGLAQALQRLFEDQALRQQLGAAGPARARQLCDPAAQLGRLRDLLAGVTTSEVPG
jgi:glycosyltransferase involved in cell wall biosynthesis